jgi:sulfite exporter TauE/SafE
LRKEWTKKYSFTQNQLAQQKLEKILLLNTGLDLAYITTGFLLKERGNSRNNLQNIGYGNSLLLQGAFLLIFDLVQYGNHRRNGKILEKQLSKLQIHTSGNGIGLRLPL